MDISRFKHQHVEILEGIDKLRQLSRAGVKDNAKAIAARLNALSQVIIQHLAIEDRILYPRLERGQDQDLVELSRRFRTEMADVRSEEHTSELQSRGHLVCRLLLEKKKKKKTQRQKKAMR